MISPLFFASVRGARSARGLELIPSRVADGCAVLRELQRRLRARQRKLGKFAQVPRRPGARAGREPPAKPGGRGQHRLRRLPWLRYGLRRAARFPRVWAEAVQPILRMLYEQVHGFPMLDNAAMGDVVFSILTPALSRTRWERLQ